MLQNMDPIPCNGRYGDLFGYDLMYNFTASAKLMLLDPDANDPLDR